MTATDALRRHLDEYRELRAGLEREILPIATSVDGRRFEFQAPLAGMTLPPGGYAKLGDRLGQVLSVRLESVDAAEVGWEAGEGGPGLRSRLAVRVMRGEGLVLSGDGAPFHDAAIRPADAGDVAAWLGEGGLPVGELRFAPGVPFTLDPGGFDRHTFLCGQSGSGKSYALGVVLEQLLLGTDLRVVILDPNSDFARFGAVRADADPEAAERWRALAPRIAVRSKASEMRLKVQMRELGPEALAAMLRLDPIADREEYAELSTLVEERAPGTVGELSRPLTLRARNLGVDGWGVWARGESDTAVQALADDDVRCLVLDIGSLDTREEQALVAGAVLRQLWERRADRRKVLVVIDEAHNVCPRDPPDALTALAADHAVRIAAEGRKFGLHLLVCTQRPQKVQLNVLSQCDNLLLMRMGSAADLAFTGEVMSFAPRHLLEGASTFGLGEALAAGKVSSHPALIRFGRRVAEEGGADIAR